MLVLPPLSAHIFSVLPKLSSTKRLGLVAATMFTHIIYCILAALYRDGLQKVVESIHHGENFAISCLPQVKKFNLFTTYVMTYIDTPLSHCLSDI